jgi:zinc transporter 2
MMKKWKEKQENLMKRQFSVTLTNRNFEKSKTQSSLQKEKLKFLQKRVIEMEKETRLKLAIVLSLFFMIIEVIGGYLANSIAIFSDAAHLLTDIAGFGIALLATIAAKKSATTKLTFGFARAEVFGALASILSLWVITVFLLIAAYDRASKWFNGHPEPVNGFLMFIVACFGVLVNLCLGQVFHEDHGGSMHPGHSHEHHHHENVEDAHSDHGHEHGHSHSPPSTAGSSYQNIDLKDLESGHEHGHSHSNSLSDFSHAESDHDHSHGHDHGHGGCSHHEEENHDHDHGHDHGPSSGKCGHSHKEATEKTSLLSKDSGYSSIDSHHEEDHPHHGHLHAHNHGHHGGDVNIEAAYLHVLTDLIQSVGVAIAGLIMWRKEGVEIIDPICTLLFSIVALYSTIPLLSRVFLILFEGVPSQVCPHSPISVNFDLFPIFLYLD